MFTELPTAFPDLHIEVEHLTADGDDVAYTMTGTHQGPLKGHPPTGKSVRIRGMQISRVERWGSSDELGMMTQLGLVQP